MKKCLGLIIVILIVVIFSSLVLAEVDQYGNLQLKNDYIAVIINQNEFNRGRFAINVTGGAPMRSGDDGKTLIYGHPHPWTSYTTIRIDDKNYIFGGKTDRRAGKNGHYGEVVQQPTIEDNSIITRYKFGEVVVSQILNFAKSSTTGLADTIQISYKIENNGQQEHKVGVRVMLDTMLGENDGAPFRVRSAAVTGDQLFLKDDMPPFWQAFDTLVNPKVTAQGTVKGLGLTTPDELYFADWGSLADDPWVFDFNSKQDFIRKGEFELDSAMAVFWKGTALKPGESKTYLTNYGLGGITIVPGLLSLGVTSPSKVVMDRPNKKVQIVAYIQNTAEITAKNVEINLELPQDLELLSTSKTKKIGDLKPEETTQIMWEVRPKKLLHQRLDYNVEINAKNTDSNQVSRALKVIGPPKLSLKLEKPEEIKKKNNQLDTEYSILWAKITNYGDSMAYGINAYLALPPGIEIPSGDLQNKFLGYLRPGQSIKIPWHIKQVGIISGELPYSVEVSSENTANKVKKAYISIPKLEAIAKLELEENKKLDIGDYFTVNLKVENITGFYRATGGISYNQELLEPVYISRGKVFVKDDQLLSWHQPEIDYQQGLIKDISGVLDSTKDIKSGIIASIHFRVKADGKANLKFNNFNLYNAKDKQISLKLKDNQLSIGGN